MNANKLLENNTFILDMNTVNKILNSQRDWTTVDFIIPKNGEKLYSDSGTIYYHLHPPYDIKIKANQKKTIELPMKSTLPKNSSIILFNVPFRVNYYITEKEIDHTHNNKNWSITITNYTDKEICIKKDHSILGLMVYNTEEVYFHVRAGLSPRLIRENTKKYYTL